MPDNQEYVSLKLAFEPFAKFEEGTPIRLLPQGTWYRGDRQLEVTQGRLVEMAKNFADGLPRFRIPINLDHEDKGGKVGTITNIQYLPDGPKGPGLYATDYEFSTKGLEAIEENGYDAVSAEVVWTVGGKTGGKYQDPDTGKEFDNVLVGMALTPRPFFGHGNVALFSATPSTESFFDSWLLHGGSQTFKEYEQWIAERDERDRVNTLNIVFRDLFNNIWDNEEMDATAKVKKVSILINEFKQKVKSGAEISFTARVKEAFGFEETLPDATMDIIAAQIETMANTSEPDSSTTVETENTVEETVEVTMADDIQVAKVELSQEDFAALTNKAKLADTHEAEIKRLEDKRKAQEAEQKKTELRATAESYVALPVEVDDFVAKMTALEIADPEAAGWVRTQFAAFDEVIQATGILEELGTGEEGKPFDLLAVTEQILTDKFEGDRDRYDEALLEASQLNPALADA